MPKRKFKHENLNDAEMMALQTSQRSQRRTRDSHEASFMNSPSAFHECVEVEYLPAIKPINKEWTRKIFDDVHADKEVRVKRTVVPKEQVALLVDSFNPTNFMHENKIKSRTFVDLFAAGSEINLNLKPVLESRFGKAEFKFISVDIDTKSKAKNVQGGVPMNIFRVHDNWKVLGQNVICAPPISGMSDAAIMYFAEHCKDFCAFLVPAMWLADRAYPLRRMWWAKKQEEKLIYELEGVQGMRWIVCVKEKRKGQDLFANTGVQLSAKPAMKKAYAERKQEALESAPSDGGDALEVALRNDAS
ncbi:hypothetical protein CYMTET_54623 [Cymbomonas tetramitiformis]|uniref:Uncharacterized protein n=1 Tax=Cymbomonas tetramitiformis TaxID=36881 RepID=A0AAE0BGC4_9CHLO|nr:hypothetical protein CYMTET_54623 [Cymbomonas tetramitiformis]